MTSYHTTAAVSAALAARSSITAAEAAGAADMAAKAAAAKAAEAAEIAQSLANTLDQVLQNAIDAQNSAVAAREISASLQGITAGIEQSSSQFQQYYAEIITNTQIAAASVNQILASEAAVAIASASAISKAAEADISADAALVSQNAAEAAAASIISSVDAATTLAAEALGSADAALASENAAAASAASISGDAATATTKAGEAADSAAAALASENAAAATAATISDVAAQAASATTKAGEAADSAAAALVSETAAAGSASSASTSAGTATTKAGEASGSASSASTSAGTATTKAAEAAASAAAALVSQNAAAASASSIRPKLSASRTYFVATTGNDSNDGLTAGTPFLTLQRAANVAMFHDLGSYTITVSIANGTYTSGVSISSDMVGGGQINFVGNQATPSSVLITGGFSAFNVASVAKILVAGVKFVLSSGGHALLANAPGAQIFHQACDFGALTGGGTHMYSANEGKIAATGNYAISGGAAFHIVCIERSTFYCESRTVTLTGTPAFVNGFCYTRGCSMVYMPGNIYSGAATGVKYNANTCSIINVAGASINYLPGNTGSGVTATGGQYS